MKILKFLGLSCYLLCFAVSLSAQTLSPQERADKAKIQADSIGIEVGMSYEQVVKILGSEGELQEVPNILESEKVYMWKRPEEQSISVTFKENKVRATSFVLKQEILPRQN